ncbi:MAG TPA: NB-ARC domain-containing protein [Gemmatimonadaceae bacterium]|nr:NB-ARC domain-containing protein [Gemmatimonadaceae bacterium]
MKRCPECRRDYHDETLLYCLDDGTALVDGPASGEALTAIQYLDLSVTDSSHGNLPGERTRFVGRARELDECVEMLASTRLLTITGFGGCGKTRLAIKIAEAIRKDFRGGAWFVDLSAVVDESMIVPTIARVFELREDLGIEPLQNLVRHIGSNSPLLVLDNCEHILPAARRRVDEILSRCVNAKIITTSREALNVQGERVFALQPLTVPAGPALAKSDAVDLFADRAAVAQNGFAVSENNLAVVTDIVRQLDGIPLAIELAAARLRVLSLDQIHTKLQERFRLLAAADSTRAARHKTLQAAIQWSYDPLSDDEKLLLQALSVFAGGCDLDGITKVFGCLDDFATLDLLTKLVDKSLVIVESGHGSENRYRLLETVRQFVSSLLSEDETEKLRQAHLQTMLARAETAYHNRIASEDEWADILEVETSNLQQALEFVRQRDADLYLQLAGALGWFWKVRSRIAEGREHLSAALAGTSHAPARPHRARALWTAAHILSWAGEVEAAERFTEEALASCEELGDSQEVGLVLEGIGWSQFSIGKDEEACASFEECLRIQKSFGDPILINRANVGLAQMLVALGRIDEALPMSREIIEFSERHGDKRNEHFGWHYLADCALIEGDCAESLKRYKRSLALAAETGDKIETAFEIQGVAMSLAGLGESNEAEVLNAAANAEMDRIGADVHARFWDALLEKYLGRATQDLGPDGSVPARNEGALLTFDEAIARALRVDVPPRSSGMHHS